MDSSLWTDKYKPLKVSEVAGQAKAISQIKEWLSSWKKGKALLVSGPPGVGKTVSIEAICREEGLLLVRMNASDSRSADDIKNEVSAASRMKPLFHRGKIILMDEIDGISSKDRGASKAIIDLIRKSDYPVILIANDPWMPKLKQLRTYCTHIKFSRVSSPSIEKRLKDILDSEGMEYDPQAVKNLARWSNGDMRSAITDLQTACEGRKKLADDDLLSLGFREREADMFSILPTIFRCRRISVARKLIQESDKDADTVFWWIENNIPIEFSEPAELQRAFDALSRADVFRGLVSKQQNWRFKAYMVDLMASVSVGRKEEPKHGWVKYEPPKKILMMAANKAERAEMRELYRKIGEHAHLSNKMVRKALIPYLRIILESGKFSPGKKKASGKELTLMSFSEKEKPAEEPLSLTEEEISMIIG